jgi:putative hydrolase of the HAD superfamily
VTDAPIETVLFDIGGTLLRVRSSVGAIYARAAAARGFELRAGAIDERFRRAWQRSVARAASRGHVCSDSILRREWRLIVAESFGDAVPPAALDPIFAELYDAFSSSDAWELAPGAIEALGCLRALGVRLGVLSNWDSRLGPMLAALGLAECFDFTVVSHEVGYEKPHPAMFRAAIERAGTGPDRMLHVGDSREADIDPARALGMRTLWVGAAERSDAAVCGFDALGPADWARIVRR